MPGPCNVTQPLRGVQGLLVKMITGDQALIGRETAKQLGMGTNIFNTEVLLKVMPVTHFSHCTINAPCGYADV